jgi:hypothetical protein
VKEAVHYPPPKKPHIPLPISLSLSSIPSLSPLATNLHPNF